jgi:D-alanyl-lipoteichoic acid acyltransferase DltB (MBOAT superfamily)
MLIAIIYDILQLFVFKYLSFTLKNISFHIKNNNFDINILLPIGISFFTFQIMSYILDVYHKKTEAQNNFFNLALYVSMFPQLIAGPIVRYETIANEINNRTETAENFTMGVERFVIGLGKKLLIANYVGFIADKTFSLNGNLSVASAWLGAISYTLQIYFDFSAYSDMAIGLGKIFGFNFLENFNYPYISKSISEFWRRWHISLGSWFRDYVYIPLGGNRVTKKRNLINLFIVWSLTGIWHGANWTFILWGLFYYVLIIIERFFNVEKKLGGFSHIYTLFLVIIGWVLFRSENIHSALDYLSIMFGLKNTVLFDETFVLLLKSVRIPLLIGILLSMPVIPMLKKRLNIKIYTLLSSFMLFSIFILSLLICIKSTYNPFIYFNF